MKTNVITFLLLLPLIHGFAQQKRGGQKESEKVTVSKATFFGLSKPLSEMNDISSGSAKLAPPMYVRKESNQTYSRVGLPNGKDPVLQDFNGTRRGIPPLVNFEGTDGSAVPDASGGADENHFVQATNGGYEIFDKEGNSVKGPFELSTLWPGSQSLGDPIVLYDEFAERWFISQFQDPNQILVAISETKDALGKYYTYKFEVEDFPDYYKVAIWPDAYYITANSTGNNAIALEREKMLVGDAGARVVGISHDFDFKWVSCPLPADADGELPPIGTPNYIFNFTDDGWNSAEKDEIQIFKMEVDWDNPAGSSLTLHQSLETEPFDTQVGTVFGEAIDQKGSTQQIDAILNVFCYRAQYRRWVEHNSVTLSHTVDVDDTDRAGIRWYELRDDGNGTWEIYQQGTYSPDEHSRFIPSISMDKYGNIGLAYCISSKDMYPGLRYTGRLKNDPLGEMTVEEVVAAVGTSTQEGTDTRYGDYAHMSMDVDDITFWHTGPYVDGKTKTRIFSFQLADLTNVNSDITDKIGIDVKQMNNILNVDVKGLKDNNKLTVDLFTLKGKLINGTKIIPTNKSFKHSFNIGHLAKGAYLVRFGNESFQEVVKVAIN